MCCRDRDGARVRSKFCSVRYNMALDHDRPHAVHPCRRNHATAFCGLLVKQYPVYSLDRCHAVYHGDLDLTPATDEVQEFPILGKVRDEGFQGLERTVGVSVAEGFLLAVLCHLTAVLTGESAVLRGNSLLRARTVLFRDETALFRVRTRCFSTEQRCSGSEQRCSCSSQRVPLQEQRAPDSPQRVSGSPQRE